MGFSVDTQRLFKAFLELVALINVSSKGNFECRLSGYRVVYIKFEVREYKPLTLVDSSEERPPSSRAR